MDDERKTEELDGVVEKAPGSPDGGGEPVVERDSGQVAANRRWRAKDPDRYREYMREYMRRKRGEG